jgi:3-oxoacyl-[acyl-carrier protein] reductase
MSNKLTGKVALVTGGSRGIGAAIALALADDGADVAISYSSSEDKAKQVVNDLLAKGVRAHAFKADQSKQEDVSKLVQSVIDRFGRLDILVNNAGVFASSSVSDRANNLAEIEHLFAVNVGGVAAAVRAAAPMMHEGGRIISIGSVAGDNSPWAGFADYSATKGAVAAYTRGWARDLGPRDITVNNVAPGPIATDMAPVDGEMHDALIAGTALGRYGKPEEVAALVTFLAGPTAGYITGATLAVDGGMGA